MFVVVEFVKMHVVVEFITHRIAQWNLFKHINQNIFQNMCMMDFKFNLIKDANFTKKNITRGKT